MITTKNKQDGNEGHVKTWREELQLHPLVAVLLAVLIYFLAQVIAVNVIAFYGVMSGVPSDRVEDWLSGSVQTIFAIKFGETIAGILLLYACLRMLHLKWRAIGIVKPQFRDALMALIAFGWYILLHLGAVVVVGLLAPQVDFDQPQQLGFSTSATGTSLVAIFISLVILPPLYEELLMRGFLFSSLRSRLSFQAAMIVVSSLFALAHLEWGGSSPLLWAAAIDTFVLSVVLVYLRERTGSLWPAIGLHAIKNGVAFMLLFVFKVQ
jgi:membrane protease YdiL (CAAX protease family)